MHKSVFVSVVTCELSFVSLCLDHVWQIFVGFWEECLEALEEAFLCPCAGESWLNI